MTQQIDPVKLKAAAEHLEWVCQQHPDDKNIQALYSAYESRINDAKSCAVVHPVIGVVEVDFFMVGYWPDNNDYVVDKAFFDFFLESRGISSNSNISTDDEKQKLRANVKYILSIPDGDVLLLLQEGERCLKNTNQMDIDYVKDLTYRLESKAMDLASSRATDCTPVSFKVERMLSQIEQLTASNVGFKDNEPKSVMNQQRSKENPFTQKINPEKLKAAAEHLEWVCQQYPNNEKVQGLYIGLFPMIEDAKAGRILEPIADRFDVPFQWAVSSEGLYDQYVNPDLSSAYVDFATEMLGGLTEQDKRFLRNMELHGKALLEGEKLATIAGGQKSLNAKMQGNTRKIRIWLYGTGGIGVILEHPSGVVFCNQVGGHTSYQEESEFEGIYVPLRDNGLDSIGCKQEEMLIEHFTGPKWHSWCFDGIDEDDANFIDSVLAISDYSKKLKVDRANLKECRDAWIHVIVDNEIQISPNATDLFGDLHSQRGILTWEDSD